MAVRSPLVADKPLYIGAPRSIPAGAYFKTRVLIDNPGNQPVRFFAVVVAGNQDVDVDEEWSPTPTTGTQASFEFDHEAGSWEIWWTGVIPPRKHANLYLNMSGRRTSSLTCTVQLRINHQNFELTRATKIV